MENLVGSVIDHYQIQSLLGRGGMGVVYKAYDTKLERFVAIKMMSNKMFDNERYIERFKREAKNQANLTHPNIVTVYGFIEYEDLLGIVMEYVEGYSLEKVIKRDGKLTVYDTVYIMRHLLVGMGYAHNKGFVHRDIKPSNIIFNKEGVAKIMDFGISKSAKDKKFTKAGAKLGTIYYMSPEQIRGEEVNQLSDIYSIGATFYEMLVGEPPFYYENEYDIMDAHVNKMPRSVSEKIPEAPKIIDDIIARSMAKNPYERFHSCDEFLKSMHELEKYLDRLQEQLRREKEQMPKKARVFSVAGLIFFLMIIGGISYFLINQVEELLSSGKLEELNTYNVGSLFNKNEFREKLGNITTQQSGLNDALNSCFYSSKSNGFIAGVDGLLLKTTDGGNSWNRIEITESRNFNDIFISKSGLGFAVGDSSMIISTNDNFNTFQTIEVDGLYNFTSVYFIDDAIGFIIGSKGILLVTENGGRRWEKKPLNTSDILFDISFANIEVGFIVGWNGIVFKTEDKGKNWESLPQFTKKYLKSVDFINEDVGIVVGGGGAIFRTNNAGKSWAQSISNVGGALNQVKFINEDNVLIAGSKGMVLYSETKGKSWESLSTGTHANFNGLSFGPYQNITVVGVNGTIVKLF